MKTIFDFNPTKEELYNITAYPDKQEYLSCYKDSADDLNRHLALLFWYRNKPIKMRLYARRIKDIDIRNSFWRNISHS